MECRRVATLLQPWELDFGELESLDFLARGSGMIGIGEGAHFTSEFSMARASLIRYFVEKHGFNSIGLECGAIQGEGLSVWLSTADDAHDLKSVLNPLTFALYGSVLAHNNHIQKTPLSFSGELTAVPMGQHLAHREDYRAIGLTHLGLSVPEMQYPSPRSPLGFSVEPVSADVIQKDSVEKLFLDAGAVTAPCVLLADEVIGAKRMRSQSASVQTNINEAFDAIVCVPGATPADHA